MLSFDLRSLESTAAPVEGTLSADDGAWVDGDLRPTVGVKVTGRLSAAGADKFYFSGHMSGASPATCRRCLEPVEVEVNEELHLLLVDASAEEADEPDVYVIDVREHELDLRPAIREEWLLAVPSFAVCSESCQGLCPQCGGNRNTGGCSCTPAVDPRWSALTSLNDV